MKTRRAIILPLALLICLVLAIQVAAVDTSVVLSSQNLTVGGKKVDCEKYNINGSNYFKLRDLAYLLNGTDSQFAVGYDEGTSTVTITTGQSYKSNGSELVTGIDNSATAKTTNQTILINGTQHSELTVYNIGGSNFFQLRELGNVLGFGVDYNQYSNTAIVWDKTTAQLLQEALEFVRQSDPDAYLDEYGNMHTKNANNAMHVKIN